MLTTANKAIEPFKVSFEGDQTLLTTLTAVQIDLQNALSKNVDPIDAFGIAVKAAESFTTNVLYGQSFCVRNMEYILLLYKFNLRRYVKKRRNLFTTYIYFRNLNILILMHIQ